MGLDQLISSNGNNSQEEQPEATEFDTNTSAQSKENRPKEVTVKEDRSDISCLDCKSCHRGEKAPVKGLARDNNGEVDYGYLMICDNFMCEDSIFDFEDPPLEFVPSQIHRDINSATSGELGEGWF